ncbi:MAG TPA: 16S rRNA (guanine(966)-N(2))-methyltransferase RsmD [Steroidobacteraceae bacterium]|nr:16S rRNA (guanine(966)-N(2))-methyltransferase RsmD [Steroidobacteraceae bacterium]
MPRNNRTDAPRGGRSAAAGRGEIRIIGGEWRGRKLHFPQAGGLRPTPDRVRETVFNWLQFDVAGKHCLDLFAGSGALGFEALSRGAAEVVFVERDPAAVAAIRDMLARLRCDRARVEQQDAFGFLATAPLRQPFDIVFLDPPYDERGLGRVCELLERGEWLASSAWIYLEDAASRGAPRLPPGWALLRSKTAGDVGYHLARRDGAAANTNTNQQGRA